MSDQDFRTWLKNRLNTIDKDVKAPASLKGRILQGISDSK